MPEGASSQALASSPVAKACIGTKHAVSGSCRPRCGNVAPCVIVRSIAAYISGPCVILVDPSHASRFLIGIRQVS
eukprot:24613_6